MKNVLCLFALFLISTPVFGQIVPPGGILNDLRSGSAARYSYVTQGEQSIEVDVWGTVRFPGRFEVPLDSDLADLIALSGGPNMTSRDTRIVTSRTIVKVSRESGSNRSVVFEQEFDNLLNLQGSFPSLETGDVVMIETLERSKNQWLREWALPVAQLTATIFLIIYRRDQTL